MESPRAPRRVAEVGGCRPGTWTPCTSFCDFQLQNRGTRTFQSPLRNGTHANEQLRNQLAEFSADVWQALSLVSRAVPRPVVTKHLGSAVHAAASGCYRRALCPCTCVCGDSSRRNDFQGSSTTRLRGGWFRRDSTRGRACSSAAGARVGPSHRHRAVKGTSFGLRSSTRLRCARTGASPSAPLTSTGTGARWPRAIKPCADHGCFPLRLALQHAPA